MRVKEMTVTEAEQGMPLVAFLADRMALSRKKAKTLLDSRTVFVNRARVWMAQHTVRSGDRVMVNEPAPSSVQPDKITILHKDADYIVADKPAGLLSNGSHSVEEVLQLQMHIPLLRAVHRLDRETTGCLLFARSPEAFERIIPLFKNQQVCKVYEALVVGAVRDKERTISIPLDGLSAVTQYHVFKAKNDASHLSLLLHTGRTHQIRKHLLAIGHPVLGDKSYGTRMPVGRIAAHVSRQMLHARRLEFMHPQSGRKVSVQAPLPKDFVECLRKFGLQQ